MCYLPQKINKYDQEMPHDTLQPNLRHLKEETKSTKDNQQR